jgi:hypothetical protein
MKRRRTLIVAAVGIMVAIAAIGQQKAAQKLLLLDWAGKAQEKAPPLAILIEMGLKDAQPKNWSAKAKVDGAKVVHREGYRFRDGDKLTADGWEVSSHKPLRGTGQMPKAVTIVLEPVASVGVVYHLAEVQPNATLSLSIKEQELENVKVPLKDVLAGKPHPIAEGRATVRLISTASVVYTGPTEDDFPAAAYGPDGTLWLAWIAYHVQEEDRRIEPPQLKQQPKDFKDYFHDGYHDQLLVKYFRNGKWSNPFAVTDARQDLMRCAIAVDKAGVAWVAYSAQRNGVYDVYVTSLTTNVPDMESHPRPKMGPETKLRPEIREFGGALCPVMATDAAGNVHVAFQTWKATRQERGRMDNLFIFSREAEGWKARAGGRGWPGGLAFSPDNKLHLACDEYNEGDYDALVHVLESGKSSAYVAGSARFEARPSVCFDTKGRLWMAYEEGHEKWGKDFGALDEKDGNPLYFGRAVKVMCVENGKQMQPVAELPPLAKRGESPDTGQKVEAIPRYAYPKIGIDGKGRVWLTYRQKFGTRYTTHPGSYWLHMARRLEGDRWSEPIELHHSDGLLDNRPVLLPHPAGGLRVIHNTDGRYTTPDVINNQLYQSYVDLPGDPPEPKLVAYQPGPAKDRKAFLKEAEDVERIRDYRIEAGGKKYQLLRGEFHRHTELSWDGGPDGSLEDMWRYGIDAAAMDWIGNGDHDNGAGREYSWWLVQKTTDAYHVKDTFTPMFTYERSVSYPHGHRNCMFAKRGIRTLPRLAEPDKTKAVANVHADDTKMLYRYLKELDGICAVHTSATSMGTDWRDNDPAVEPIVEIYQGDRMSYEKQEAPRAGYDPKSGKKPANIAGWYPDGFIDIALGKKGHKLGFQASSDHFSTHISYCIAVAERHDRAAILDALKKRHCYGATDNIILDVKSGTHIMGDEFKSAGPPTLEIKVIGTASLAKVEVLKDSEVVQSFEPKKTEFAGKWTDPKPTPGVHYYYVRVQQADSELAWSSPMWIEFAK